MIITMKNLLLQNIIMIVHLFSLFLTVWDIKRSLNSDQGERKPMNKTAINV